MQATSQSSLQNSFSMKPLTSSSNSTFSFSTENRIDNSPKPLSIIPHYIPLSTVSTPTAASIEPITVTTNRNYPPTSLTDIQTTSILSEYPLSRGGQFTSGAAANIIKDYLASSKATLSPLSSQESKNYLHPTNLTLPSLINCNPSLVRTVLPDKSAKSQLGEKTNSQTTQNELATSTFLRNTKASDLSSKNNQFTINFESQTPSLSQRIPTTATSMNKSNPYLKFEKSSINEISNKITIIQSPKQIEKSINQLINESNNNSFLKQNSIQTKEIKLESNNVPEEQLINQDSFFSLSQLREVPTYEQYIKPKAMINETVGPQMLSFPSYQSSTSPIAILKESETLNGKVATTSSLSALNKLLGCQSGARKASEDLNKHLGVKTNQLQLHPKPKVYHTKHSSFDWKNQIHNAQPIGLTKNLQIAVTPQSEQNSKIQSSVECSPISPPTAGREIYQKRSYAIPRTIPQSLDKLTDPEIRTLPPRNPEWAYKIPANEVKQSIVGNNILSPAVSLKDQQSRKASDFTCSPSITSVPSVPTVSPFKQQRSISVNNQSNDPSNNQCILVSPRQLIIQTNAASITGKQNIEQDKGMMKRSQSSNISHPQPINYFQQQKYIEKIKKEEICDTKEQTSTNIYQKAFQNNQYNLLSRSPISSNYILKTPQLHSPQQKSQVQPFVTRVRSVRSTIPTTTKLISLQQGDYKKKIWEDIIRKRTMKNEVFPSTKNEEKLIQNQIENPKTFSQPVSSFNENMKLSKPLISDSILATSSNQMSSAVNVLKQHQQAQQQDGFCRSQTKSLHETLTSFKLNLDLVNQHDSNKGEFGWFYGDDKALTFAAGKQISQLQQLIDSDESETNKKQQLLQYENMKQVPSLLINTQQKLGTGQNSPSFLLSNQDQHITSKVAQHSFFGTGRAETERIKSNQLDNDNYQSLPLVHRMSFGGESP